MKLETKPETTPQGTPVLAAAAGAEVAVTPFVATPPVDPVRAAPAAEGAPAYLQEGRDLRIDFLRGLIMLSVLTIHVDYFSALSFIFWERVGIVSSAEGFVLASGIVLGIVHMRTAAKQGLGGVTRKVWDRAAQLYRTYLGVTFTIVALRFIPFLDVSPVTQYVDRGSGTVYPLFPEASAPIKVLLERTFRMQCGPHQYQIIGLYVVLLLLAPVIIAGIRTGWTRLVLGVSWALYLANIQSIAHVTGASFEYAFPSQSWQLLFVHGMVIGAHWKDVSAFLVGPRGRWLRIAAFALALCFALFSWNHPLAEIPDAIRLHFVPPDTFQRIYGEWFMKTSLGLGRVANVAALFVVLIALTTHFWKYVGPTLGEFFIPIGQATLYVFVVHVFLIVIIWQLPFARTNDFWVGTAIHAAVIGTIYAMVRYRVLFNVIPR